MKFVNNKINKIITFFTLMFLMFISINAVSLNIEQDYTGERYLNSDIATIQTLSLFGNENQTYTYNNITYYFDTRTFISYLDTEFYISYNNQNENTTIDVILTSSPEIGEPVTTAYVVHMQEVGLYHLLVKPAYTGENIRIEVNAPPGYVDNLLLTTTKNKYVENINTITGTFVGAMKDLIDINIGFWKMFYYIFIIGIIIGSLGLLINFAFKVYDWAERTSDKKRKMFSGSHK